MTFSDFVGNEKIVEAVRRMIAEDRLPQTLLFAGPSGTGKATLARLLAAALLCRETPGEPCGACRSCLRVLQADLSSEPFQEQFAQREKLPPAKRAESPLIISTHPDFLIFPPDGPLRLITIEQARRLRQAAQFGPSEGKRRVFVIDHADRANNEAANSLLKTLEEPAPALTLVLTAENSYDLLPTIRSRSIPFYFTPLSAAEMERFFDTRPDVPEKDRPRLAGWAQGSPGRALTIDVDVYLDRRAVMLTLTRTALSSSSFAELLTQTERIARKTQEKLDVLTDMLFGLLQDLLRLRLTPHRPLVNEDIRDELAVLAVRTSFRWIEKAVDGLREIERLQRRNIQKQIALEALAIDLRTTTAAP